MSAGSDTELEPFEVRARRVIDGVFGGEHHVASMKFSENAWERRCSFLVGDRLATYDYSELTKLVVYCHDQCVRAEIQNGGPARLKVTLTSRARKSKHPDSCAHPTLDQHVEQVRRGGSYQPLFDQLREGSKP